MCLINHTLYLTFMFSFGSDGNKGRKPRKWINGWNVAATCEGKDKKNKERREVHVSVRPKQSSETDFLKNPVSEKKRISGHGEKILFAII